MEQFSVTQPRSDHHRDNCGQVKIQQVESQLLDSVKLLKCQPHNISNPDPQNVPELFCHFTVSVYDKVYIKVLCMKLNTCVMISDQYLRFHH